MSDSVHEEIREAVMKIRWYLDNADVIIDSTIRDSGGVTTIADWKESILTEVALSELYEALSAHLTSNEEEVRS